MSSRQGGRRFGGNAGGGGRQQPQDQPGGNQNQRGGRQRGGGQQRGGYDQGGAQRGDHHERGGFRGRGGPRDGQGGSQRGDYGQQGGGQRGGRGGGGEYRGRGGPWRGEGRSGQAGRAPDVPEEQPTRALQIMKPNENHSTFNGKLGRPTKVVANYFWMGFKNGMQLSQYRVDYYVLKENGDRKEITTTRRLANRERFWKFVEASEQWFKGKHNLAYDDSHLLYTVQPLDFGEGDLKELLLTEKTQKGNNMEILMVIKPAALFQIRFDDHGFKVLNLILTQFARCPIGRLDRTIHCDISRMFIKSPMPVDMGGFQLLKGLYGFAKRSLPQSGQAFANFDVTHSAFYKVGVDILQFYAFAKRGSFLSNAEIEGMTDYGMDQKQRNELRSLLNGLKVKKKHMNCGIVESEATFCNVIAQNSRTYRFQDDKYGDKDGMISVFDYYRTRYGYEIKYPIMPLIQLMPRDKKLMVPIEILRVSDKFQRLTRKLPDKLQGLTNKLTTTSPRQRFSDIDQMVRDKILVTEDPFLEAFNVEIDPQFVELDARILQQPNCAFARGQLNLKAVENPHLGGQPVQVLFDLIIVKENDHPKKESVRFDRVVWNHLAESCRQRGINLRQIDPLDVTYVDFNANTLDNVIEARVKEYVKFKNVMPICVVIMPDNRTDIYKAFKGIFELRFGVRSQMLTKKAYDKLAMRSELPNSAHSNWSKFVDPKSPTLFIGIDVTHPAPGDTLSPSISALVGNIDVHATRFTATVRAQQHRTEWIQNMHEMFKERLKHFKLGMGIFNKNGAQLPSKIIVFRDGVSESQFVGLMEFEVPGMSSAIDEIYGEAKLQKPKLTMLVVQKRHNTRFYDQNDQDFKNKGNLQPGTVVDGFITSHSKEFYLCSHKGMLGTSKPAHYFVIHDENKFTPDDLQVCANNLCYLFARAPMPVSIPAPVYYAHLACFRARHHWAAADDGLRVGQDGQPLARETQEGEEFIVEPAKAVVVQANLKPTMYFC